MKKSFRKLVKEKLERYAKLLGVSDYSYRIVISKAKKRVPDADCESYGSVVIDEETRDVIFTINEDLNDEKELENTIIHELLHVRVSEFFALINQVLDIYVKNKKTKDGYTRSFDHLEHKVIVATTKGILNYGKQNH